MLFQSYKLNNQIELKNRIIMAPLTRCFADDNLVPTETMANYYERRADAGLIITEATIINPCGQGYPNTPGLYSPDQIAGWRNVTDKVHAKGGKIFAQLWHTGRASHSIYHDGALPLAPSPVALEGRVPRTADLQYEVPKAMSLDEIQSTIQDYHQAALNAIEAGFDGVELHAANGYLIDQFLHQESNHRDDAYGGSIEKRCRFLLEILQLTINSLGAEKVGIRLSPAAYFNMNYVEGDEATFMHLLQQLSKLNLAYVHVGMFADGTEYDYLGGRVSEFIRRHYQGTVIGCGSYSLEQAQSELNDSSVDLVAFGRPFIANPDFVEKVKKKQALSSYEESMLAQLV